MEIGVSIIIVNWNSDDCLKDTVESIYRLTKDINFEVIIVDNASNQSNISYQFLLHEAKKYQNLKVIFNNSNSGFAKANNLGIDVSQGKYILLLNPDINLQNNAVEILSSYLDKNPDAGMVGPKVLNPDGSFQFTCMRGAPNPLDVFYTLSGLSKLFKKCSYLNKFSLFHIDNTKIQNVFGLSGCCMMVKKSLIKKIGKMDEQFFLYLEETDWCFRAYQSGWKVVYNPNAIIVHDRGYTCKKEFLKTNFIFCDSMAKFFKKNYSAKYNLIQISIINFLIWNNFFIRMLRFILNYQISPINLMNLMGWNLREQANENTDRGWPQPAE